MPAEAPFALQWPGCRNTSEAFPTRLGGRVIPDAVCILSNDFIEGHLSDGIERVIVGLSRTPG
ncbi:MAG: hypothetical protein WD060_04055, partial [Pirellulales bacterium]